MRSQSGSAYTRIEQEGSIAVPLSVFSELVGSLPPNEKIEMQLVEKALQIRCARFEAHIGGIDSKMFPPVSKFQDGVTITAEVGKIRQAINYLVFATASSDSRPVLRSINAKIDGNSLTLAASDGFRLAVYKMNLLTPTNRKFEIIIPSSTLKELNRLLSGQIEVKVNHPFKIDIKRTSVSEEIVINHSNYDMRVINSPLDANTIIEININQAQNLIIFKLDKVDLTSRLTIGNYPQYEKLIPQMSSAKAIINVRKFLEAAKIVTFLSLEQEDAFIRLIISPMGESTLGKITIYARSDNITYKIGEVDAIVEGGESKIAVKPKFLIEMLTVIEEESISLETTNPTEPCVIKPMGLDNYAHVIMPLNVQW